LGDNASGGAVHQVNAISTGSGPYRTAISGSLWVPVTTAWRVLRSRVEKRPLIWRVDVNILSSRRQPTRCGPPAWGLGEMLTNPHRKNVRY